MTPNELYLALAELPQEAELVFSAPDGAISGGYHVTEWKAADVTSIDCGGVINQFTESQLQLLDGRGGDHMQVGKFNAILKTSIEKVEKLGESQLRVEFGQGNQEMRLYDIHQPNLSGSQVSIALGNTKAVCKPAERAKVTMGGGCCGSAKTSCC